MDNYIEKVKKFISKNKKRLILGVSVFVVASVGLGVAGTTFVYNKAKSNINYTSEEAKEIALELVKGDVLRVRKKLELENCSFEYEFKIKDENNMLVEVTVDSTLGVITDLDNCYY